MVLPRQGADHQSQPQTRMDHGTRTPVLEPHPRNVLPRVRPDRPRHEDHGEKRHAVEHEPVVVRHRLRHLPGTAPLPLQRTEGARTQIPPRAGLDRAGHLGTDQLHPRNDRNQRRFLRLHLPVHPYLRLQVVPAPTINQTNMGPYGCRRGIRPALYGCLNRSGTVRHQQGNLHHRRLETPRGDDRLRHVPAVRPRHFPQPYHQPDRAIRVRRVPDHRLRRLRETTLGPAIQPEEPLPTTIGNPTDPRHPAGDLHGLHPARFHPPSTVRRHHRPPTRTLVRSTMEQGI